MVDVVIRYVVTLHRHSGQIDRPTFINIICCPIVFGHVLRVAGYAMRKMDLTRNKKVARDDMKGEGWRRSEQARE